MSVWYRLEGHVAVPTDDPTESLDQDRTVAKTTIGKATVSTVFLGLDHAWGSGPPMLFETMVFGGGMDRFMVRCSTWEQAERRHAATVRMVQA